MGLMIIHHKVKDFAAWKPIYDAHELKRIDAGLSNGRVFQSVDDANDLVILFDMADAQRARDFAASEDMRTTMAGGGVLGPPTLHFLEAHGG